MMLCIEKYSTLKNKLMTPKQLIYIYIKDLEDALDLVLDLYADDLVLWVTRSDIYHIASDMKIQLRKL